jgi:hypothetical protein
MKVLLLCIFIYLLKRIHQKKVQIPIETDILLSPGGYKGFYMVGICHYVKNHFSVANKSITGFSCGSFLALFMRIKPELEHTYLKYMFALDRIPMTMPQILDKSVSTIRDHFVYEDFDLRQTQIGVSTLKGLELFHDFTSLEDILACCRSSSFVPFVTQLDAILFYKNKLTFDGGIHYKKIKRQKKKETLLIGSSMFGRFGDSLLAGFKKPKCSYYQLYLYGYRDAQKNHAFFASYF